MVTLRVQYRHGTVIINSLTSAPVMKSEASLAGMLPLIVPEDFPTEIGQIPLFSDNDCLVE